MNILSIETSCDETSVAIAELSGTKRHPKIRVHAHIVSSQAAIHRKYGGVVPNLARREHEKNLVPILLQALDEANLLNHELGIRNYGPSNELRAAKNHNSKFKIHNSILTREQALLKQFEKRIMPLPSPKIDAIAVTYGPGLAPALWTGVNFARALSCLWGKPLIPVNHMAGHLYSAFLSETSKNLQPITYNLQPIKFPVLALLVSGGHTELVLMRKHGKFEVLGETLDDAAGEAFDKVARILGLKYPGGPEIAQLAIHPYNLPPTTYHLELPRPMLHTKNYNFSFSGLKTAVLYLVRDLKNAGHSIRAIRPEIAREFQQAVADVLVAKTIRAAKEFGARTVSLGGGVAANQHLREILKREINKQLPTTTYNLPPTTLTGDNALMIALAAYFAGTKTAWHNVHADANVRLSGALHAF